MTKERVADYSRLYHMCTILVNQMNTVSRISILFKFNTIAGKTWNILPSGEEKLPGEIFHKHG